MRFEVADLLDLNSLDRIVDITWFSGLFYHLADPLAGLKTAADQTEDLLFVITAVAGSEPDEVEIPNLPL